MNIRQSPLLAVIALVLSSLSRAEPAPAPTPLAPSVVVAAAAKPKISEAARDAKIASVEAALSRAVEGLKGGCETARDSGESPFQALQSFSIQPPEAKVVLAAGRCPDRMVWACHPACAEENPQTGKCMVWVPVCGCE